MADGLQPTVYGNYREPPVDRRLLTVDLTLARPMAHGPQPTVSGKNLAPTVDREPSTVDLSCTIPNTIIPFGPIAQRLERPAHNRLVPGSNPGGPTPQEFSVTSFQVKGRSAHDGADRGLNWKLLTETELAGT